MVIYNGVHYDALAITARPNASNWEDDVTEFNPRTRRGKMILEAARQLVRQAGSGGRACAQWGARGVVGCEGGRGQEATPTGRACCWDL
jgi:hypothetical protein